ncbi:HlyC/CorC family transporter [Helcococcus ovis]|uniref:HlyC/CorC family transporter n=1 Tax=Helcococcus ovis TaxID=72026 RepID=UPI0038BCC73E
MDSEQIYSVILFFICIILSAFFSASETAFTSLRVAKLKTRLKDGDKKVKKTLEINKKYDDLLSAILIGNNIVNIGSSAIATLFFVKIFPVYGALVSTVATTILLLILGEITPKLIAKIMPESLAIKFTKPLSFMMIILKPVIWTLSQWQKLIRKFVKVNIDHSISEEELLTYIDEAKVGGSIEDDEHVLVKAAVEFDDVSVSSILIPRVDIIGVEINDTDEEIEKIFDEYLYSRLIVYEETVDKVLGIILERDFHKYLRRKQKGEPDLTINSIISDILYIPGMLKLSELLKLMQKEKKHMAAIIDEHGGLEGIVTMEDILEELVGEIWDESDEIESEIKVLERNKIYEVSGRCSLDKIFEFLKISDAEEYNSNTIAGFIVEILDKMPRFGDSFVFENFRFTVKEIEGNRIEKVVIKKIK